MVNLTLFLEGLKMIDYTVTTEESTCIGKTYRGKVSTYIDKSGIIHKDYSLKLLKKKSCKGCKECGYDVKDLANDTGINDAIEGMEKIEDGKLYKLEAEAEWTSEGWEYPKYKELLYYYPVEIREEKNDKIQS
jgi:hypothetical protein